MVKFFAGLGLFLLTFFVEVQLAAAGIHLNLILAVLITFALLFEFREFIFFAVLAVFLANPQPSPSAAVIALACIPLGAYISKRIFTWQLWIRDLITVFLSFLIFYLVALPGLFLANLFSFAIDLAAALVLGQLILAALQ